MCWEECGAENDRITAVFDLHKTTRNEGMICSPFSFTVLPPPLVLLSLSHDLLSCLPSSVSLSLWLSLYPSFSLSLPKLEPPLSIKLHTEKYKEHLSLAKKLSEPKPEPLEPSHALTVTEPNQMVATLIVSGWAKRAHRDCNCQ